MSCPKPIRVVVAEVQRAARRAKVQRIIRHARDRGHLDADDIAQDVLVRELVKTRAGKPSEILDGTAPTAFVMNATKCRAIEVTRRSCLRNEEPFPRVVEGDEHAAWEPFDAVDEVTPSPDEVLEDKHTREQADAVVAKLQERGRAVDADPEARPREKRRIGLVLGALAGMSFTALAAMAHVDLSSASRMIHRTIEAEVSGDNDAATEQAARPDDTYSVGEAAQLLGRNADTIRRYIALGVLPTIRDGAATKHEHGGARHRIPRASVEARLRRAGRELA